MGRTGNAARSQLAAALLNREGAGRSHAYSAGSHPAERTHPLTLEILEQARLPTAQHRLDEIGREAQSEDSDHRHASG